MSSPLPVTKIKRVLTAADLVASGYEDLAQLATIFNHDAIETSEGLLRWKENSLVGVLFGYCPATKPNAVESREQYERSHDLADLTRRASVGRVHVDLNTLTVDLYNKYFSVEEWMKFYMQLGYSLGGFCEVFGQVNAHDFGLPDAKVEESDENNGYAETVIQYMVRIHKGKVLRL